jgi:transmembrane sensor
MSDQTPLRPQHYEEAAEWLLRLQEDQSTEQIERWIEWCSADPKNQQAFERLMPLWQVQQAMPAESASQSEALQPAATVPAAPSPGVVSLRRRHPWVRTWVALAAAASVAVAVVGLLPLMHGGGEVRLAAVDHLSSRRGQARSARLSDGSQVALGAQSQIAVHFGGGQRQIEIERGEAFFNVHHNRAEPFVVGAGGLQVVAVGTAFDVDRRGSRIGITVQEGVVEVTDRRAGSGAASAPMRVARGSQLIIDETGADAPALRAVSPDAADGWRRGRFEYVGEPLSSVIEDLNRYSGDRIVLQDAALGALRYSGTIDVTLIDEWLRALPTIFAVSVQSGGDHQVTLSHAASAP